MELDLPYLNKLNTFIQASENKIYTISDLTDDPEKFIFHLKYYIDHRNGDDLHLEFNSPTETEQMYNAPYGQFKITDYKKFKVMEFFDGKIKEQKEREMLQSARVVQNNESMTEAPAVVNKIVVNNKGLFQ